MDPVIYQKQSFGRWFVLFLLAENPHWLHQPAVAFHWQSNLRQDLIWWKFRLPKSQQYLSLRIRRIWRNFLRFPYNLIILERMSSWNRFTIKHNKILIQVNNDIEIINFILPFLVHLVLEGELDIGAINLLIAHEQ